jgi:hypothetical protein
MNIRTMYIRDRRSQQIGSLAISVDRKNKRVSYQLSMAHPKDMKDENGRTINFDSAKGRLLALERLIGNPIHAVIKSKATMHDITSAVMTSLSKSEVAPSRAIKFAKSWLKETITPVTPIVKTVVKIAAKKTAVKKAVPKKKVTIKKTVAKKTTKAKKK